MNKNNPQKIIEKVKDSYNLIAREWDISRNKASQLKINLAKGVESKSKVLDIGCGNALMLPFILKKNAFYFGLDISEKLIKIAKKKYTQEIKKEKAKLIIGQATELPFQDKEFDFVISFATLHHIPSKELQEKFFREIKRVSKSNAKIKIIVWNLYNGWTNKKFDIENKLKGKKSGEVFIPWKATQGEIINRFIYQFSKEELLVLAKNAGFKNIKINLFNRAGEKIENGEEMVLEMEA